jgi:hypothetical protein
MKPTLYITLICTLALSISACKKQAPLEPDLVAFPTSFTVDMKNIATNSTVQKHSSSAKIDVLVQNRTGKAGFYDLFLENIPLVNGIYFLKPVLDNDSVEVRGHAFYNALYQNGALFEVERDSIFALDVTMITPDSLHLRFGGRMLKRFRNVNPPTFISLSDTMYMTGGLLQLSTK